jgi:Heat induced stress protein YflT
MTANEHVAVAVVDDLQKAESTIDELRRAGFREDEIGIVGHVNDEPEIFPPAPEAKTPERNAEVGIIAGGIWGALIGVLGAAVAPGLGAVTGWGMWFELVVGAALGAAAGGVLCALGSLPFSQPRARFFRKQLDQGRFIVTVNNPQRREEAALVLRQATAAKNPGRRSL